MTAFSANGEHFPDDGGALSRVILREALVGNGSKERVCKIPFPTLVVR